MILKRGESWINKDTISNHQIKPIGFKIQWKDIYCMACCETQAEYRRSGWRAYWRSSLVCGDLECVFTHQEARGVVEEAAEAHSEAPLQQVQSVWLEGLLET